MSSLSSIYGDIFCSKCGILKSDCDCPPQFYSSKVFCSSCHNLVTSCTCNNLVGNYLLHTTPHVPTVIRPSPETELARFSPGRAASLLLEQSENLTLVDLANSLTAREFASQGRGTEFTVERKFFGITYHTKRYSVKPS